MTTHNFVVLAAGRGSRIGRIGDTLHKSLLPLENRAIISHQFSLAPRDSKIIVVVGFLADQVVEYVRMAHPDLNVEFVYLEDWEKGGPGYSLLNALRVVDPELPTIFVTCDTLWKSDDTLWSDASSWAAVAPMPFGTEPSRWMLIYHDQTEPQSIRIVYDKDPKVSPKHNAWTGLAMIQPRDLGPFTRSLESTRTNAIGQAFQARREAMIVRHINWLDVGDEAAYRAAVIERSGYDWTKVGQATYILPSRVIKFFDDPLTISQLILRSRDMRAAVAPVMEVGRSMISQLRIQGPNLFEAIDLQTLTPDYAVRVAIDSGLWQLVDVDPVVVRVHAEQFYRQKTMERIEKLSKPLRARVEGLMDRVPWDRIYAGVRPINFHGDFTLANLVYDPQNDNAVHVDIRPQFVDTRWGDAQYDYAKLLSSGLINWHDASRGVFSAWVHGPDVYDAVLKSLPDDVDERVIEIIAGLCLINSAPLHSAPFDEVLITRGASHLEALL